MERPVYPWSREIRKSKLGVSDFRLLARHPKYKQHPAHDRPKDSLGDIPARPGTAYRSSLPDDRSTRRLGASDDNPDRHRCPPAQRPRYRAARNARRHQDHHTVHRCRGPLRSDPRSGKCTYLRRVLHHRASRHLGERLHRCAGALLGRRGYLVGRVAARHSARLSLIARAGRGAQCPLARSLVRL